MVVMKVELMDEGPVGKLVEMLAGTMVDWMVLTMVEM